MSHLGFIIGLALGALICDGNADGRVTIDELVAGVNAAMHGDPCATGCAHCPPDGCYEFPNGYVNGECLTAIAEQCWPSVEQCLPIFCAAHPSRCVAGVCPP